MICVCRNPIAIWFIVHVKLKEPKYLYIWFINNPFNIWSLNLSKHHIRGLVQHCGNSSELETELLHPCTEPFLCYA